MHSAYNESETKKDISGFENIYNLTGEEMRNDNINILILNFIASYENNTKYENGNNIIIGGNSLGRGVPFSQLQTIYYC